MEETILNLARIEQWVAEGPARFRLSVPFSRRVTYLILWAYGWGEEYHPSVRGRLLSNIRDEEIATTWMGATLIVRLPLVVPEIGFFELRTQSPPSHVIWRERSAERTAIRNVRPYCLSGMTSNTTLFDQVDTSEPIARLKEGDLNGAFEAFQILRASAPVEVCNSVANQMLQHFSQHPFDRDPRLELFVLGLVRS